MIFVIVTEITGRSENLRAINKVMDFIEKLIGFILLNLLLPSLLVIFGIVNCMNNHNDITLVSENFKNECKESKWLCQQLERMERRMDQQNRLIQELQERLEKSELNSELTQDKLMMCQHNVAKQEGKIKDLEEKVGGNVDYILVSKTK